MRAVRVLPAVVAALLAGCQEDLLTPARAASGVAVRLELSDPAPGGGGGRVAVVVRAEATHGQQLAGLQGTLRYDPSRLRYAGQLQGSFLVMVGDREADRGDLRVLSLDVNGLPDRTAVLVFDVLGAGWARTLGYAFEAAATRDLREIVRAAVLPPGPAADLVVPVSPRRMRLQDWYETLAPDLARLESRRPARVPGQFVPNLRYGDATLNGSVNILDAARIANVAVGNEPLLTDAARDYVIAGNVHPANLPGLGEDTDPAPPGQEAGGAWNINVLDAAAVNNEAVGNDFPVVGELIPGRAPPPASRVVLSGVLTADRVLTRDTVYELQGLVIVQGGTTLTIQPGTRIEGDGATRGALAVYRGANLVARGTRLEPIVFTCDAAVKAPGCWGGVVINGLSLLNNGTNDPCPTKYAPTSPGGYGGCLVFDTSGVMRYVRIEYAGMAPAGGAPVAGLSLLGVGYGTVVESVQVHRSLGDGLFVSGGTVNLRSLVLTGNAGAGLRWNDGWGDQAQPGGSLLAGRGQFIIVQQPDNAGPALHGRNADGDFDAGPRSNPRLFNVTLVGGAAGSAGGILLEAGTAGTLQNVLMLRPAGDGLDIDDAPTIAQAGGATPGLNVAYGIFFGGAPDFSADADGFDEAAWATDPFRFSRVTDPLLLAALNTLTPDLRPLAGAPPTTGAASPPADGFFNTTAAFVGAVPAATSTRANIPWYAGWTAGW